MIKHVVCDSGLDGWQCRLRENYVDLASFQAYSDIYGLAERLGFDSAEEAWDADPLIQGSAVPSDYRRVE